MKAIAKTIAAIVAVIATTTLAPLSASAHEGECMDPTGQHFKKMGTDLGLSAKQQQDMQELFSKSRARNEPLLKQMATERRALRALIHADSINEAAIRAQSGKVAAAMADLAVQRAQTVQQIRALLTPEQIQKFKTIQAKHDNRNDTTPPCGDRQHRKHR